MIGPSLVPLPALRARLAERSTRARPARLGWVPLVVLVAGVGCGNGSLPENLVAPAAAAMTERAAAVDLILAPADAECAARKLTEEEAGTLLAAAGTDLDDAIAEAVIDCVGDDAIARTALAPFTAGSADASLACAGERLDDELISELLAARLSGRPVPRAEVELSVVAAVSLCLEPEELRGRG